MRRLLAIMFCTLVIQGCASGGAQNLTGEKLTRSELIDSFKSAQLRLTCDAACSGSWGSARATAKRYYTYGLWIDLVYTVAEVGHRVDLTYYYLGRAAEELKYTEAAKTYYRLAQSNRYKCDAFLDTCDDVEVSNETRLGLKRIQSSEVAKQAETRAQEQSSSKIVTQDRGTDTNSEKPEFASAVTPVEKNIQIKEPEQISSSKTKVSVESKNVSNSPPSSVKSQNKNIAQKAIDSTPSLQRKTNDIEGKLRQAEGAERDQMIAALKKDLKDPYSAKFGNTSVLGDMACLGVNSKNGFGAYTGMKYHLMIWHDELKEWFPMNFVKPGELHECLMVLVKDR
ncbi:hypothetical protein Q9252_16290 [Marinobacter salarius]|uniref:hypothetical protein n=1 Tax=Marinobacter salarius TaxID=1420917 RepID=UPI00273B7965|nr:hypothetical protein [Marinobacter salarius]MDP4533704.1 hypothetical protein [Marinobacter salarius]